MKITTRLLLYLLEKHLENNYNSYGIGMVRKIRNHLKRYGTGKYREELLGDEL